MEYKEYELGELLYYEQPTPYIVESTDYIFLAKICGIKSEDML